MDEEQRHEVESAGAGRPLQEIGKLPFHSNAAGRGERAPTIERHLGEINRRDMPTLARQPDGIPPVAGPQVQRAPGPQRSDLVDQGRIGFERLDRVSRCVALVPDRTSAGTGPLLGIAHRWTRRPTCSSRCSRIRMAIASSTTVSGSVSYTHLRAHETRHDIVCRLLLEKKKKK